MSCLQKTLVPIVTTALTLFAESVCAQAGGLADIQTQLTSLYQTAKATADGTDLVTAGSVLVLQKDHLVMIKVDQPVPIVNAYKNGAISQNSLKGVFTALSGLSKLAAFTPFGGAAQAVQTGTNAANAAGTATGAGAAGTTREFVTGEKFWVTEITTKPDGVYFALMSDPIKDQRYKAVLEFPFAKGATPSADDVAAVIGQVVKIEATDQGGGDSAQDQGAKAPTKTIAVGQSRDEVVATFGVPTKVVKLPSKEIDIFPDMKVTFVHDKVTNVE